MSLSARRALSRLLALAPLAGGLTCSHAEPDPLDPDVVEDIAKEQGDAEGSDRSGAYTLKVADTPTCDCPATSEIALCSVDLTTFTNMGVVAHLTQNDGALVLAAEGPESGVDFVGDLTLSGPLDSSGDFDLGGIYDLGSLISAGNLYIRLTGRFTGADRFEATLSDRARGSYGDQSIDCRTEAQVVGTRVAP